MCHWMPCICQSRVEVTQEEPVEVIDLDEEEADASFPRTN